MRTRPVSSVQRRRNSRRPVPLPSVIRSERRRTEFEVATRKPFVAGRVPGRDCLATVTATNNQREDRVRNIRSVTAQLVGPIEREKSVVVVVVYTSIPGREPRSVSNYSGSPRRNWTCLAHGSVLHRDRCAGRSTHCVVVRRQRAAQFMRCTTSIELNRTAAAPSSSSS